MILAVLALVQTVVSGSQAYFLHFGVSVLCRYRLYYAMARLRVPLLHFLSAQVYGIADCAL